MDFGKIFERVKAILTTPRSEWPIIAAEPATIGGLYTNYIVVVAALPVIAAFIKNSLIGTSMFGIRVSTPIGIGIVGMILQYALMLALAYVMALIVNALAPTFGAQKDMLQALKTVAYAWTASWIAGIAAIIPWLGGWIAIAGAIYGIYLLYLGLPNTMKCPPEKAGGYTAVSVIIAIVLSWIVILIMGGVIGTAVLGGAAISGMHITGTNGDNVTVDGNSALGKLAAMGQRADQASREMQAAQKSGDTGAQQAAMGKMMGAMAGNNSNVESISADQVKSFLPDALSGMKRQSISAERNSAMGMHVADAKATYVDDQGHSLMLEVADTGSMKGLVAMAGAMAPDQESETDHGYDKTYTDSGRLTHEQWDSQSRSGEYSVVIGQRFTVKASGQADSIDKLKQAVASVDLAKLESLKDQGVTGN